MKQLVLVGAIVTGAARLAAADPMYACHAAAADTKMSATFAPTVSLHDLAAWVLGFTCKNIVFTPEVAQHATKVVIIAPNPLTPKQGIALFKSAVEATGLVVTETADTITIKLGPNMPRNCPDATAAANPPVPPITTTTPTPPPAASGLTDAELDAGIKKVDDTHYTIARALVDKLLADPMAIDHAARIVPSSLNGVPNGFKLYAIRPTSVYARLGFQNGDTLHQINGMDLDSADKALEVYTKVRDARTLDVAIIRRGKTLVLHVAIK